MWVKVVVPVTSLCPCSKKISERGAHNQRSHVTISAKLREHMWIEELIEIAENEASCELYGILKRPDEKVRDRARLRQSEIRRGPGARRGRAPERRAARRGLRGRNRRTSSRSTTIRRTR
jgi:hypothetical protein